MSRSAITVLRFDQTLRFRRSREAHEVGRVVAPIYGAPPPTEYDEATPERLAEQMRQRLRSTVAYAPVQTGGALRAAQLIAPLIAKA
jgi:hypothetical protein